MQPALLPDVAERDVRQVRGGVPFGAGVFRRTEAVQRLQGDTARGGGGSRGAAITPRVRLVPPTPAVTQRLWGDSARGAGIAPVSPRMHSLGTPSPRCHAETARLALPHHPAASPGAPSAPPALTPSVKKLLSMRRLGTRLGILLWESSPVSGGRTAGRGRGFARCPDQPYLRIFPSSRNVFSPSSHDLERSVVMASR